MLNVNMHNLMKYHFYKPPCMIAMVAINNVINDSKW